jgi:hypothetical protein
MLKRWMSLLGLVCLAVLLTVLPVLWAKAEPNQGFVQPASSIPSKYDWTKTTPWNGRNFSEGLAAICFDDNRGCGYVNTIGQLIIMTDFTSVESFQNGMAPVTMLSSPYRTGLPHGKTKYGFIDKSGKLTIPLKFDSVGNFNEELAAVKIEKRWGYINKQGKIVIRPKFYGAGEFHDGVAVVHVRGNRDAIINKNGKIIKVFRFSRDSLRFDSYPRMNLPHSSEGLMQSFDKKEGFGYMNTRGELVIPHQFSDVRDFSEGLAFVSKKASLSDNESNLVFAGYIDRSGKTIISLNIKELGVNSVLRSSGFKDGLAMLKSDKGCKYINRKGQIAVEIDAASSCYDFSEGLTHIIPAIENLISSKDSKDGAYFIDKLGRKVFSLYYRYIDSFHDGLAHTVLPEDLNRYQNHAYLDKEGKIIFQSPARVPL